MEPKDVYTVQELYDNLEISMLELSRRSDINPGTLLRIKKGYSARRPTVNKLLRTFSEIYNIHLSVNNVSDLHLEGEKVDIPEKPPKRAYNRRKDTGLPEGCILATDFARVHNVDPRTFYDHMLIGLGPGTIPGEMGDPMLPVKEQIDYSERDKPGRKGERERYLTPAQQTAALDFWKRHGVAFTVPESEQEAPVDESWWTEPGAE